MSVSRFQGPPSSNLRNLYRSLVRNMYNSHSGPTNYYSITFQKKQLNKVPNFMGTCCRETWEWDMGSHSIQQPKGFQWWLDHQELIFHWDRRWVLVLITWTVNPFVLKNPCWCSLIRTWFRMFLLALAQDVELLHYNNRPQKRHVNGPLELVEAYGYTRGIGENLVLKV